MPLGTFAEKSNQDAMPVSQSAKILTAAERREAILNERRKKAAAMRRSPLRVETEIEIDDQKRGENPLKEFKTALEIVGLINAKEPTYDEARQLIQSKELVGAANACVPRDLKGGRYLLSALLIAKYPYGLFGSEPGEAEAETIRAAGRVLRTVESENENEFKRCFADFKDSFTEWQNPDLHNLILALYARYIDLEMAKPILKEGGHPDDLLHFEQLKTHQLQILTKIRAVSSQSGIDGLHVALRKAKMDLWIAKSAEASRAKMLHNVFFGVKPPQLTVEELMKMESGIRCAVLRKILLNVVAENTKLREIIENDQILLDGNDDAAIARNLQEYCSVIADRNYGKIPIVMKNNPTIEHSIQTLLDVSQTCMKYGVDILRVLGVMNIKGFAEYQTSFFRDHFLKEFRLKKRNMDHVASTNECVYALLAHVYGDGETGKRRRRLVQILTPFDSERLSHLQDEFFIYTHLEAAKSIYKSEPAAWARIEGLMRDCLSKSPSIRIDQKTVQMELGISEGNPVISVISSILYKNPYEEPKLLPVTKLIEMRTVGKITERIQKFVSEAAAKEPENPGAMSSFMDKAAYFCYLHFAIHAQEYRYYF